MIVKKKQQDVVLPRGITARQHKHGKTLVVSFTYKGVKCREPLSGLHFSPKSIKYAERLRGEILNKIGKDDFNYQRYFSKSKKLLLFGLSGKEKTVSDYLNEYVETCGKRSLSVSTINGYMKCIKALKDLNNLPIKLVTSSILKRWIKKQNTSLKTIRNQLSFLKNAINEAVIDEVIAINPVNAVKASSYIDKRNQSQAFCADPLTHEEVELLLSSTKELQCRNLFRFAINTGLRSSELCALKWSDVDLESKIAHVNSASVLGVTKSTKTLAGERKVQLNSDALLALKEQRMHTRLKSEHVFHDPKTGKAWAGADAIRKKAWAPAIKRSGIRYRNPYQTRHTFATRHISQGANIFWLAAQMGHKTPEMLFRHYGKYLESYNGNTSKLKRANET